MSENDLIKQRLESFNITLPEGINSTLDSVSIAATVGYAATDNMGYLDRSEKKQPEEPFELVSDIELGASGSSIHDLSYAIEYTALGPRNEIRNLKADTFKIEDNKNYRPSVSSFDPYLIDDIFDGRGVAYNKNEFISIDIQPYLSSKPGFVGINNYTTVYSRPEIWREIDGGPEEPYVVTEIESVKHFVVIPPDEKRIAGLGTTTSTINREYGFYFRHYDNESYWMNDPETEWHWQTFLSENSYAFYYGKIPDGRDKKNGLNDILDLNENSRYRSYSSDGRWGVYIDDEVINYIEGRILVGHNIGIGTGLLPTEKEPIVSIFNNKYKDLNVENPEEDYQIGLFVEDTISIGARNDTRYRLNVDASTTSAGILANTVEKAARFVGDVEIVGGSIITGTGSSIGIGTTSPSKILDVYGDVGISAGDLIVGTDNSTGLVLTSPNGTKYRLIVDNAGILTTTSYP